MFPTPLAILIFFAPESPWWLVRKGRLEEAARSVVRLGRRSLVNEGETVAMMRRVIEMEKEAKRPSHLELFKGTDFRRTAIVCGVYLAQNLTGNLIANQAVYFFKRMLRWTVSCSYDLFADIDRIWRINQHCVCTRSHHLGLADDLRHAVLDSYLILRSTFHLPVGFCRQHRPAHRPRNSRNSPQHQGIPIGRCSSWLDRFRLLHAGSGASVVGHYRRDIGHSSEAFDNGHRPRGILHRRIPLHLP